MKRHIPGLSTASTKDAELESGFYLVRIAQVRCRWDRQKPFYTIQFQIEEPAQVKGQLVTGRLYCTVKALWKMNWFLHDFGYDLDLMERDELDEAALRGLRGVIKISHTTVNGQRFLNLDAFAGADQWGEWYAALSPNREVA